MSHLSQGSTYLLCVVVKLFRSFPFFAERFKFKYSEFVEAASSSRRPPRRLNCSKRWIAAVCCSLSAWLDRSLLVLLLNWSQQSILPSWVRFYPKTRQNTSVESGAWSDGRREAAVSFLCEKWFQLQEKSEKLVTHRPECGMGEATCATLQLGQLWNVQHWRVKDLSDEAFEDQDVEANVDHLVIPLCGGLLCQESHQRPSGWKA